MGQVASEDETAPPLLTAPTATEDARQSCRHGGEQPQIEANVNFVIIGDRQGGVGGRGGLNPGSGPGLPNLAAGAGGSPANAGSVAGLLHCLSSSYRPGCAEL
jgi:hypothetical protein